MSVEGYCIIRRLSSGSSGHTTSQIAQCMFDQAAVKLERATVPTCSWASAGRDSAPQRSGPVGTR